MDITERKDHKTGAGARQEATMPRYDLVRRFPITHSNDCQWFDWTSYLRHLFRSKNRCLTTLTPCAVWDIKPPDLSESLTLASPPTAHGKEFLYSLALKACCYSFPEQTFSEPTARSILVRLESPRTTRAKSCELRSSSSIWSVSGRPILLSHRGILEINLCLSDGKRIEVACALLCSAVLYCILSRTRCFVSCCCFGGCTLSRNLFILLSINRWNGVSLCFR